jgi:hypothetical protein
MTKRWRGSRQEWESRKRRSSANHQELVYVERDNLFNT